MSHFVDRLRAAWSNARRRFPGVERARAPQGFEPSLRTRTHREWHTAEEIRDELWRLLNEHRQDAPLPVLLPMRREVPPGEDAANWAMQWHESYHGDTCGFRVVSLDVQSRWNLREDD